MWLLATRSADSEHPFQVHEARLIGIGTGECAQIADDRAHALDAVTCFPQALEKQGQMAWIRLRNRGSSRIRYCRFKIT